MSVAANAQQAFTDRQKNLLLSLDLPAEYDDLQLEQRHSIARIEEMLSYLENKYKLPFIYTGYIIPSSLEKEELMAYPDGGNSDKIVHLYCSKQGDGMIYEDNFEQFLSDEEYELSSKIIFAKPYYDNAIASYIGESYDVDNFKVFTNISMINTAEDITEENALQNLGSANHIFINKSVLTQQECDKFISDYAKHIQTNCSVNGLANSTSIYLLSQDEFVKLGQYTYLDYMFTHYKYIYISHKGDLKITDSDSD